MRPTSTRFSSRGGITLPPLPQRLIDWGLLAVVFLAPLFMGGRGPVGKFVFVSLVCVTALAWSIAQCRSADGGPWRRSGVEWLLLASVVLVVLQLIPLPPWLLSKTSPLVTEVLPLWTSAATVPLGDWSTVSLTPVATRGALVVLLGYILLFLLVIQRIESIEDVARILRWVALGTIAVAILGLAQFLVGNGKFLWVFEHPSRDTYHSVKGPFHNQNHFAHLLALGVGPMILSWLRAPGKSLEKHLFAIGMGIVLVAGLLTFSRGGAIAILIASTATVAIYSWQGLLDKRALACAGLMGAIVVAALMIHGYGPLSSRIAALRDSESFSEAVGARADLWSALLDGIPHFAWLGSGIGSHVDVYPLFMEEHYSAKFTHGENGYLPLALEGGVPAFVLLLTGIGICFWWSCRAFQLPPTTTTEAAATTKTTKTTKTNGTEQVRGRPASSKSIRRESPPRSALLSGAACIGAIAPGLLASVLHSLADFVWYISACMSITVVLAACACRLSQMAGRDRVAAPEQNAVRRPRRSLQVCLPRPTWVGVAIILTVVSAGMMHDRHAAAWAAPHWYDYQRLNLAAADDGPPEESVERDLLFQLGAHLEDALAKYPHDPVANLKFANICLRRFELEQRQATNPMALQHIREAALASKFASREAQEAWLNVAVGENMKYLNLALVHCHRALRGAPLQGDGYVYLANLSFLESPSPVAKTAYIDQALRVRPYDSSIAFAMGQERALAGDVPGMLEHWVKAFHRDPRIRTLIIEHFSHRLSAEEFVNNFDPDTPALRKLRDNYQRLKQTADVQHVTRHLVTTLVAEATSADRGTDAMIWFELQGLHAYLEELPQALQCAQRAVELDTTNVRYRRALGTLLLRNEDFSAATRELEWCLRRKPDDPSLLAQLTVANRGRMQR